MTFLILSIVIGLYYIALLSGIYYSYSKGIEWFILLSTAFCIQFIGLHAIWYPKALVGQKLDHRAVANRDFRLNRQQVEQFMNEKQPYKVSGLKLSALADQLHTTPHELSHFLNEEIGMSFFEFINSYRINEAREKLLEFPDQTILMTAYEVGFNSKTTFNRAFKKQTQMTPREYRLKKNGSTL